MKDSYLTAGIRFRPLVRLLSRNKVTWTFQTCARILFLLQSACWSSLFSRIERMRFRSSLEKTPVPDNPIFIVGHWRTGSTLLHQLMACDPLLTVPTLFQVALPENFLVSYRFYKPLLGTLMGSTRPMDNVKIGMDEPQEDEYALFRLTTRSPLERLIFPAKHEYFLKGAPFFPTGESMQQWGDALRDFLRKVYFVSGKQIVSKNPFNSMRIPLLLSLFPNARFIHIVRHPYEVVPSTQHLWKVVQKQNILNRNHYYPDAAEISEFLHYMMNTIHDDLNKIPEAQFTVIRYEDLVQNPLTSLKSLYRDLDMPFTEVMEDSLNRYIKSLSGYKKNAYTLSDEEKNVIEGIMRAQMKRFGYSENA